ncbi:HAD family hydrolase [Galbitalea soli]|uniref:HAD-IB family hydrolase n=1 Tax=Galbitalea soli TaxID=1268042 RepID=A0A7C9TQH0_9MICO|nr:HAD-IB family hydrolase [Galbitalea soli]NEM90999.1 HAD-IB family hydrolase [Galbitalea soli]NYJ29686.1 HAD superfamily hydrolase (TIGR01490 family) [Galbitalea soli]
MPDLAAAAPSDAPIVAFFDVDNTLLRGASVWHIAKAARRQRILTLRDILRFCWHQAMFLFVGENDRHLGSVKDRALELIVGYSEQELATLAGEVFERDIRTRLWPETVGLTREHLAKGHQVWLITATPQIMAGVIAERLGLTGALGTQFEATDGIFTGRFDGQVVHGEHKAVTAAALTTRLHADLADCWAYSDSRNDIPLLTLVGHRVVVNPDSHLSRHARLQGWPIMQLKRASIKDARRRVRREARASRAQQPGTAQRPRPTQEKR